MKAPLFDSETAVNAAKPAITATTTREKIRKILQILHFHSEFLSIVVHFVAAMAAVKLQIFGKFDGKIGEFAITTRDFSLCLSEKGR